MRSDSLCGRLCTAFACGLFILAACSCSRFEPLHEMRLKTARSDEDRSAPPRAVYTRPAGPPYERAPRPPPSAPTRAEACLDCHPTHRREPVHQPRPGNPCLHCHAAHTTADPPRGDTPATKSCTASTCHSVARQEDPDVVRHEPYRFGWCVQCHEHSTSFRKPADNIQIQLCLKCHDGHVGAGKSHQHPPEGKGTIPCTFCHHHHEGPRQFEVSDGEGSTRKVDNPRRLVKPEREICAQCHAKHGSHHIAPGNRSMRIEKQYPLARAIKCTTCHQPHFSQFEHLRKDNRTVATLCASCHN